MSSTITRIKRSLRGCRFRLALSLDSFEEEYCLNLFGFLIALPFLDKWHRHPYEMVDAWGFYYSDRALVLCWRNKCKFIHMPWSMDFVKWEVMQPDGKFVLKDRSYGEHPNDGRWIDSYFYQYTLRSGEVQELHARLSEKLAEMEEIVSEYGYEVTPTLLLRHDRGPSVSMLISNDDLNKVVLCIAELGDIGEVVEDEGDQS